MYFFLCCNRIFSPSSVIVFPQMSVIKPSRFYPRFNAKKTIALYDARHISIYRSVIIHVYLGRSNMMQS